MEALTVEQQNEIVNKIIENNKEVKEITKSHENNLGYVSRELFYSVYELDSDNIDIYNELTEECNEDIIDQAYKLIMTTNRKLKQIQKQYNKLATLLNSFGIAFDKDEDSKKYYAQSTIEGFKLKLIELIVKDGLETTLGGMSLKELKQDYGITITDNNILKEQERINPTNKSPEPKR